MNPGRNDPCPCGSGKKYKRCCGTVAAPAPQRASGRQCDPCTACCDGWMVAIIQGHEMKPGTPCNFLDGKRCRIYDERPHDPCRHFVCAWLAEDSPLPDHFRPDLCGVIVARIRWRDQPAYLLRSAGRDPDDGMVAWMCDFSVRTGRPFFYERNGEKFGFGPPAFQQDMLARLERGEPMW